MNAERRSHKTSGARPRRAPRIVVVGSSNTDMSVRLERLPAPGETLTNGSFVSTPGGKGANQAVGAARAGGAVSFVARIGRDSFGDHALAGLRQDGVRVDHVVRDRRAPSGIALIFVAANGENSIAVAGGGNDRLSSVDIRRAGREISRADIVLLQLETPLPAVMAAAEWAARHHVPVILNPAPAVPLPDTLLRRVTFLTPNETETRLLTGIEIRDEAGMRRAADVLLSRGGQTVILTLGARGAFVAGPGVRRRVRGGAGGHDRRGRCVQRRPGGRRCRIAR